MDEYSNLLKQLEQLIAELPSEHYAEGLSYKVRLQENIEQSISAADTAIDHLEYKEILAQINHLSLTVFNRPFSTFLEDTFSEQSDHQTEKTIITIIGNGNIVGDNNINNQTTPGYFESMGNWLGEFTGWSTADDYASTSEVCVAETARSHLLVAAADVAVAIFCVDGGDYVGGGGFSADSHNRYLPHRHQPYHSLGIPILTYRAGQKTIKRAYS